MPTRYQQPQICLQSDPFGMPAAEDEPYLAALCHSLIGSSDQLSEAERALVPHDVKVPQTDLEALRREITAGRDPLGSRFCAIRSREARRRRGATYTPQPIVDAMLAWAAKESTEPARIVDPGAGSGRFVLAAAKVFPRAQLIAVEIDPLAALTLRANAAALHLSDRLVVELTDYRALKLPDADGPTLFIGNPPYVRHHHIEPHWKAWFANAAHELGVSASGLAGLHIHFFVRTRQLSRPGDLGVFITSAEWLDVNYGSVLRQLLAADLGGVALHVLDPAAMPFADAATTGAITCFRIGSRTDALCVRSVGSLDLLNGLSTGTLVPWETVAKSRRWSTIIRPGRAAPAGYVELGELVRVHRGQVTGSNSVWIAGAHAGGLLDAVLAPAVTKARDLLATGGELTDHERLRRVVNLPVNLDELPAHALPAVRRFLGWAKGQGADRTYIAQHRRAWWAVGLRDPAPLLCTYMARRAPAFVRNLCGARHINIAHGLYPREPMDDSLLDALAGWLREHVTVDSGRTYAGGLTKFEPKEIERLLVPRPNELVR